MPITSTPCENCEAGFVALPDETSCSGCVAGQFYDSTPTQMSESCRLVLGNAAEEIAAATSCSLNRRVINPDNPEETTPGWCDVEAGSGTCTYTLLEVCTACADGQYQDTEAQTSCINCAVGQYAASTGQSLCDACDAGTYTAAAGLASCTACASGRYSAVRASNCSICVPGFADVDSDPSTPCMLCDAGYFSAAAQTNDL